MKTLLLTVYLLIFASRVALRRLQVRHLRRHGQSIPEGFAGVVDPQSLRRASAYTLDGSRLGLIESVVGSAVLLLFLFGGLLPVYDRWIQSLTEGFIAQGVLYFLGISLIQYVLELPFSLYRTFGLEQRYGFNTTSWSLWLSDQGKSLLLSALLLSALAGGVFALVRLSPDLWWLWIWLFLCLVMVFLMYLLPTVIEPLFFRFDPIERPGLEERIAALTAKAGLQVSQIRQVDASRRSRHGNAYFTGIGRVKRIVLFDTLLAQMGDDEVLAILAHEIGHWKKGHVRSRLIRTALVGLLGAWLAFTLLRANVLPTLIGLDALSFFGQLVVLSFLASLLGFWLTPFLNALSRRQEWQADRFAAEITGCPQSLASALVKLSKENLANLHPHPLFAWFYYSHPPLVKRVQSLRGTGERGAQLR